MIDPFPAGDESDSEEWGLSVWDKNVSSSRVPDDDPPDAADDASILKRAVSEGDIGTVEQLLDKGVDVETPLFRGWTPLMCAVNAANYDLAKLLLDRGASAKVSKDHVTALTASVQASGHEDEISRCVELLLSRNADPNVVNSVQKTCLMLAAQDSHSQVIDLLVSHGAEIDAQCANGYTALSYAVQLGREEAVLKLLQLGADKTIKTENGWSPADLAAMFKHARIVRILAPSCTSAAPASVEQTLSKLFDTDCEDGSVCEDIAVLLHGLGLGYLIDTMRENDITWDYLLTMDEEDLQKLGVTDPAEQHKLLAAVQQMKLNKVDFGTIALLEPADSGTEELLNFLMGMNEQFSSLSEMTQDVIKQFPPRASQLVFSVVSKKTRSVCNQMVVQINDLQKDVGCLHTLVSQMNEADCCQPPQPGSHGNWRRTVLAGVAVGVLGVSFLMALRRTSTPTDP
ncbi:ankyrin repeat, SAM and basic leucine zipper domain-containing protein 1 [Brachionichthys hirsutus]|uniref:ankyrin repeat, SAM and basic leucine zipper domain-containing protein 1 n=1 Tax=Brachionichthys hirsutus TaxID=412623 RepID=UPI003604814C